MLIIVIIIITNNANNIYIYIYSFVRSPKKKMEATSCYEKFLTSADVSGKLVVPSKWLEILMPQGGEGINKNNVHLKVIDGMGMFWEFFMSIRTTGNYKKPDFHYKEWRRFVMKKGLRVGDKFIIQREEDHFRGTRYKIRVQRKVEAGLWLDVETLPSNQVRDFVFLLGLRKQIK